MVRQKKEQGARIARRLGANIARRRTGRKWSQEELAERLGVASETISRFERGATLPSLMTLQRLASVLKASVSSLLAEGSAVPDDQAMAIATWVADLSEDDRDYVLNLVKASCDHLRRRR
jgi:transcriptional regulator with XRE-family HTH domain